MNSFALKKGWIDEQVKGKRAFRDVPYVDCNEESNMCRCNLCGTGWMNEQSRKMHFQGSRHAKNYRILEVEQQKKNTLEAKAEFGSKVMQFIYSMKDLDERVAHLGLRSWKLEMNHLMYRFVTVELSFGEYVTKEHVLDRLSMYETMEALSLLELALWKTNVTARSSFSSVQEVKECNSDEEFDKIKFLREARITSGSEIIIPLVLRFLRNNQNRYI